MRLVKLSQAALELGYHVETLRLRVRHGELEAVRGPHGTYYVSRSALATIGAPKRSGRRRFKPASLDWSWVTLEQRADDLGVNDDGLTLLNRVRENPGLDPELHRLLSVQRLRLAGLTSTEIAGLLKVSPRHVRRLSSRDLVGALEDAEDRIEARKGGRLMRTSRRLVAELQRRLEAAGFQYHERPWQRDDTFTPRGRRAPAHRAYRLFPEAVRHLRDGGLSDEQIQAIRLVGIGQDELNELILHGLPTE